MSQARSVLAVLAVTASLLRVTLVNRAEPQLSVLSPQQAVLISQQAATVNLLPRTRSTGAPTQVGLVALDRMKMVLPVALPVVVGRAAKVL
jgi:hypothetical protein